MKNLNGLFSAVLYTVATLNFFVADDIQTAIFFLLGAICLALWDIANTLKEKNNV